MKVLGEMAILVMVVVIHALNPSCKDSGGVMPDIYYTILSDVKAYDKKITEYAGEGKRADTGLPLLFKTIIYGEFEDIPWGELAIAEEIDYYVQEYQNKNIWQFVLRDVDLDGQEELVIRNEKGQIMVFYEQWGDLDGTEGRLHFSSMGEENCGVDAVLEGEGSCYFYLDNGMRVCISSSQGEGNESVSIAISRDAIGGGSLENRKCEIYIIYNYNEYSEWLKQNHIEYRGDKDGMEGEGIFYFVEGKTATKELVGGWLLENIWEEMIPAEEWETIP